MTRMTGIALWVMLALVASPGFGEVKVGYDENVDFGSYRTYAWREGTPAALAEIQQLLVDTIDGELQEGGLRRVEGVYEAN